MARPWSAGLRAANRPQRWPPGEVGHILSPEAVRRALDQLTSAELLKCEKGKGRSGFSYRLAEGGQVETALDLAYEVVKNAAPLLPESGAERAAKAPRKATEE